MKILTFELKVAVEDSITHQQVQETYEHFVGVGKIQVEGTERGFVATESFRFLRGRYVEGVKEPTGGLYDDAWDDWYDRAEKEIE